MSVSRRRRIVLFAPFSPRSGGGGTILRTLVPRLPDIDVCWLYTAADDAGFPGARRIGGPLSGGAIWRDLPRTIALWSDHGARSLTPLVDAIAAEPADGYWVVAHNEGALVARALARRGLPVHVSVHDDVPDGIFARSVRYRRLAAFVRPVFYQALAEARSLDVVCEGMRRYYRFALGRDSVVVHPCVPARSMPDQPPPAANGTLAVGHIGTIYNVAEWRAFVAGLRLAAAAAGGRRARMTMVGLAGKYRAAAEAEGDVVELVPELPEADAIARFGDCQLMYAMYPFGPEAEVFRRTSIPAKLTTYLQCRLPIFGHAPRASSLGEFLRAYPVGLGTESTEPAALAADIAAALALDVPPAAYDRAREETYGEANALRLAGALRGLA